MDDSSKQSDETYMIYDEYGFFRFTVRELIWLISLIAVGLSTFGPIFGVIIVTTTLLLIRILHRWVRSRMPSASETVSYVFVVLFLFSILVPATFEPHLSTKRNWSRNHVKVIILSAHNYESTHQHWPEPYTVDENGNRLHSWRTLLLPFAEEPDLYALIDLKSSWKEIETNKLLQNYSVDYLKSPASHKWEQKNQFTNYFAIVDSETIWNLNPQVSSSEITDDASQTIILLEVFNRAVAWYEPKDLTLDEAVNILTGKDDSEKIREGFFFSKRVKGGYLNRRVVGFADGRVETIGIIKDPQIARALLTKAGGEEIPEDWETVEPEITIGIIIHWGSCISTLLYIALALLPVFNAYRKRKVIQAT